MFPAAPFRLRSDWHPRTAWPNQAPTPRWRRVCASVGVAACRGIASRTSPCQRWPALRTPLRNRKRKDDHSLLAPLGFACHRHAITGGRPLDIMLCQFCVVEHRVLSPYVCISTERRLLGSYVGLRSCPRPMCAACTCLREDASGRRAGEGGAGRGAWVRAAGLDWWGGGGGVRAAQAPPRAQT